MRAVFGGGGIALRRSSTTAGPRGGHRRSRLAVAVAVAGGALACAMAIAPTGAPGALAAAADSPRAAGGPAHVVDVTRVGWTAWRVSVTAVSAPLAVSDVKVVSGGWAWADTCAGTSLAAGSSCYTDIVATATTGVAEVFDAATPEGSYVGLTQSAPFLADPGGRVVALPPARLLDTRSSQPVRAGVPLRVPVAGNAGVPASGASAVIVNATLVQPDHRTFLTVAPSGGAVPLAATVNGELGSITPAMTIVQLGADGAVQLAVGAGAAHVVLDVLGFVTDVDGPTGGDLQPLTPLRLVDTRLAGGALAAGGTRRFSLPAEVGRGARAALVNLTGVGADGDGYVTVAPGDQPPPLASNLNVQAGTAVSNLALVALGADGTLLLTSSVRTDVVVDLVGVVDGVGVLDGPGRVIATRPRRMLDTRVADDPVVGVASVDFGQLTRDVLARTGRPLLGVVVALTVTQPSDAGYLTVFPDGTDSIPFASNLTFGPGATRTNLVAVPLGTNGRLAVLSSARSTHVVIDLVGLVLGNGPIGSGALASPSVP